MTAEQKIPVLIATKNPGKFREIMEVLHDLDRFHFLRIQDLSLKGDPEENGSSYEENSLIKARYFFEKSGGQITIAEDSGIEVEALQNELGVKTRRWGAGEKASDGEWLEYFLRRMETNKNKKAKFICLSTIIWGKGSGELIQFRGETSGIILGESQCSIPEGIPISAVFLPDGEEKVYAALSPNEKNRISHRGKAMHQVKDFLESRFQ